MHVVDMLTGTANKNTGNIASAQLQAAQLPLQPDQPVGKVHDM